MSGGINLYARLLLGLKSKDNSGAFRCYRVSKLAEIDLSPGSFAWLFVSGRDSLLVPERRLPDRRNADPVREPARRQLEDQHERGRFGALGSCCAWAFRGCRVESKTPHEASTTYAQPQRVARRAGEGKMCKL